MEISVIIPTYKPDYYIWECLDSIKEQTLNKNLFEVLIILNGEKEPYYNDILNYIKKYNLENFKLLYTEQNGVSNARNIGLDNCNGDYIAFIDDDDYIDKEYLQILYQAIQDNGDSGIILSNYINFEEINKNIISKSNYKLNFYSRNLIKFRQTFSMIWGKLIPKKVISNFRFNLNYKNGEDSLFMLEISKNIKYISTMKKEIFYRRRMRKNSANFRARNISEEFFNSYSMLKEYLKIFLKKDYKKIFILIRMLAIFKGMVRKE